jgi:hypothetical protein
VNAYPWYAINSVTTRLEPYAVYVANRENYNRLYRPEPDVDLVQHGQFDAKALEESVLGDEHRYGWLCDDPIMRSIAHMLMHDPDRFSALDKINKQYMEGFQHMRIFDQARIHLLSACHLMGYLDDDIIAKKWLRLKGLWLWARAWHRGYKDGRGRYFPTKDQLNARYSQLPPIRARKKNKAWKWERVYSSIGLAQMPQVSRQKRHKKPTVFSWEMVSESPRTYQELEDSLSALRVFDCE